MGLQAAEVFGVGVCVWRKKVRRLPLFFLSPHLSLLFPRYGHDESQSRGVALNFSAALSSPPLR